MLEKTNGHKIVNELFERQQDFIVVGLCGKTGSGVSTIANILNKEFSDLNLGIETPQGFSDYEKHEYRILYDFAQKNWDKFYLIKTKALIIARVLSSSEDEFLDFLCEVAGAKTDAEDKIAAKKAITTFFTRKMIFEINKEFMLANDKALSFEEFFSCDSNPLRSGKLQLNIKAIPKSGKVIDTDDCIRTIELGKSNGSKERAETIEIKYSANEEEKDESVGVSNVDLYKMFRYFQRCRETKRGNLNPIYYWILQKYIFCFLPKTVKEFWTNLKKIKSFEKIETLAMQLLGNNLRISDEPYEKKNGESSYYKFKENAYVTIAKDINHSIKILRAYLSKKAELKNTNLSQDNEKIHKHAMVVIDSIKNPFESMYLKQRYSNYYLMGIYTDEGQRKQRLINSNKFSMDDISIIDRVEQLRFFLKYYHKWDKEQSSNDKRDASGNVLEMFLRRIKNQELVDALPFILQNVSSCLESADIFINNPIDNSSYVAIKRTLVRYISLMMCPGIVLPTNLERCMQIAYVSKANSGCISRQVGAVITDCDYQLLSVGWNQQPREQLPCLYRDLCELYAHHDPDGYSDYENSSEGEPSFQKTIENIVLNEYNKPNCILKEHGRNSCFCFKDVYNGIMEDKNQVHTRALHAEETAFLNLAGDSKQRAKGGFLFTTSSPCVLCAKKSKYLGISKIYYVDPYPDISYSHVLMAGPVKSRPEFILFTGAIGTAYTRLFTPLLPIKDERELWLGHKIWMDQKSGKEVKEEKKETENSE